MSEPGSPDTAGLKSELAASIRALLRSIETDGEPEAVRDFVAQVAPLAGPIGQWVEFEGRELARRIPELGQRIAREALDRPAATFDRAPLILLEGENPEDVLRSWRVQLQANLDAIETLMAGTPDEIRRSKWIWFEDCRDDRIEFFRIAQVRDCLKEALKCAGLLAARPAVQRVLAGDVLFRDDFSGDLSKWTCFGVGVREVTGGRLHTKGSPMMLWTGGDPFPDGCLVSLHFTPGQGEGGIIFALPGLPREGLDLSVSAARDLHQLVPPGNTDDMEPYNYGVTTYHVSLHRGRSGTTHLRRAGNGLRMLSRIAEDPCAAADKTYHIAILKIDESFQVRVDGKLIHAYIDAGVYGAVPQIGHFGIKPFGGQGRRPMDVWYDDVTVHRLTRQ
ncbi:MAG: hypothetical protein J7M19_05210 [Planctomycetes bacterium]|nr:hypothetical protein [Planctomycetota bacterium]